MPQVDPPEFVQGDNDSSGNPNQTNQTETEEILSQPARKTTAAKLRVFFDAYTQTGLVNQSCSLAGVARATHYHKLRTDSRYRAAFEEAQQQAAQLLEDKAFELAMEGDTHMLQFLLKRFRPNLYRERISADVSATFNLAERIEEANRRVLRMQREYADSDSAA